jgi:antitoxin ParD1/3/4
MRATMNISLPLTLKQWVAEQVNRRGFGTASEYVRQVLREEQERQVRRRIDAALIEGVESGPSTPMTRKDWDDIRQEGRHRLAKHKKAT